MYFKIEGEGQALLECGALAHLVERFHGMEEVIGSNPICSTIFVV
jgi:hypothetical protein